MSNTISPNMNLVIPGVGTEAGPDYATDINNSLTVIDSHNHAPGYGVQITPSGLNISSNLAMNTNSLISTGAITFTAVLTDASSNSLYEKGVDLYYRDGSGNVIRMTQSGSVSGSAGTITGLPSGTASATYSAGVFTFQSATATAANIDGGSYVLRNSVANSFGLTLQPPNAMSTDYSLTLPFVPAQTNVMTLDNSGNISSVTFDAVGQTMTSVGADAIGNSITLASANHILGASTDANIPGSAVTAGTLPIVVGTPNTPGGVSNLVLAGTFLANGTRIAGNGIAVTSYAAGVATVSFDTVIFSATPIIVVSINSYTGAGTPVIYSTNVSVSGCQVVLSNGVNQNFSVIAIGPRV